MFCEFSEVSWKLGLCSLIAKQESEPMKKTANYKIIIKRKYNKRPLSFLFAFRGQFNQQLDHFHFSLILLYWPQYIISASLTSVHHISSSPRLFLLAAMLAPSASPFVCLSSLYSVHALSLCSVFPKSHPICT